MLLTPIIINLGENKTLSNAGMVCRSENNLIRFKEFLDQKELKLKEHNSEFYKAGSFSVQDPDNNVICFGVLKDRNPSLLKGLHDPWFALKVGEVVRYILICFKLGVIHKLIVLSAA